MLEQNAIHVELSSTALSMDKALAFVQTEEYGGIASFIGTVRNQNENKEVESLFYEAHTSLAQNTLMEIANEARSKFFPAKGKIWISHALGKLALGDKAVIVAVATKHRAACMQACQYIIEELKQRAPIWKQENYTKGDQQWLDGKSIIPTV